MWVARDSDGMLCIYRYKPSKGREMWIKNPQDKELDGMRIIPEDCFPEVKWEDKEPRELILKPIKNS